MIAITCDKKVNNHVRYVLEHVKNVDQFMESMITIYSNQKDFLKLKNVYLQFRF